MRTSLLALLSLAALLVRVQPAAAVGCATQAPINSAAQVNCGAGPTCSIRQSYCIASGSILDFGTRGLDFERLGQFDIQAGGLATIKAGSIDLMAVGGACAITGAGADVSLRSSGTVTVGWSGGTSACIDVRGDPAGSVDISAIGSINIQGSLNTHSTGEQAFGSGVTLDGLQVTVDTHGEIDVSGSTINDAGGVDIFAVAQITLKGTIHGNGTEGADVSLISDEGGIDTTDGVFELQGQGGGFGGSLSLDAATNAVLGGKLFLAGDAGGDQEIGDGGSLDVIAGMDISITATVIDLTGPSNGEGGNASFDAGNDITQSTKINARTTGTGGGGRVEYIAQRNVTLSDVDVSGESPIGTGGSVDAEGWCSVKLPGPLARTIKATAPGGSIRLASGGNVESVRVQGTLQADNSTADSGNRLEYRTIKPVTTGASITPKEKVVQNADLTPCGGRPVCGNDKLEVDEPCDGALGACVAAGDVCLPNCSACTTCGNGVKNGSEVCDDTATPTGCPNGKFCNPTCSACTACGNGQLDAGETCDRAAGTCPAGTSCTATCTCAEQCGDGIRGPHEACDDGNTDDCDGCSSTCTRIDNVCGDGIVDDNCGEKCDDGNALPCEGSCAADCRRFAAVCGDAITECGEEADDGNLVSCDHVSSTCTIEGCGNGVPECGEECDDGPAGSLTCSPQCVHIVPPRCGDGILQADVGEVCDDGNTIGCDGCAADCLRRDLVCGDRVVECGEQCDSGSAGGAFVGDACGFCTSGCFCQPTTTTIVPASTTTIASSTTTTTSSTTTSTVSPCGNGVVDPAIGEQCRRAPERGTRLVLRRDVPADVRRNRLPRRGCRVRPGRHL